MSSDALKPGDLARALTAVVPHGSTSALTSDAVDTSSEAVERLAAYFQTIDLPTASDTAATLRALAAKLDASEQGRIEAARLAAEKADQLGEMRAERDALAADLRRATEAARAADERCARYNELVERLQRENDALRKAKGT